MSSIIACCRKWPGYFAWSLLLLPLFIHEGCKPSAKEEIAQAETTTAADTLPGDFVYFFDRFGADSNYQKSHIVFPLEGLPNSNGDTLANSSERFFWQKEGWQLHRAFTDPSQQFEQWFELIGDRVIEHWVWTKGTNLFLQRRFGKLSDGEWYLIYYAGMRPNSQKLAARTQSNTEENK